MGTMFTYPQDNQILNYFHHFSLRYFTVCLQKFLMLYPFSILCQTLK